MAMVPALQVDHWQWLSLTLAAPVAVWGAWPFHRAAWANLRHGATTMDTLVSLGVLAAFGWSLVALFGGSAGEPGMTHPFRLTVERSDGLDDIYLEVAAGVTTFLLAGRYLEKRAKRRAGEALRALLELGAREVGVLRDGVEVRVPVEDLAVGQEFVVRPGEKVATDGVVVSGTSAARRLDADRRVGAGRGRSRRRGGRGNGQRGWPAGRPGDARRRRHPAGPDGPARRCRPERQGRRAAAGRPGLGGVRARGDRPGRRHPRLLARRRRRTRGRLHRRRGGADRGVPVRAGTGHPDGPDGRHRARRPARHPDPRAGGARGHPPGRHRPARQDRHRHHRPDGPRRRGRRPGLVGRRRTTSRRGRGVGLGASGGARRGRGPRRRPPAGERLRGAGRLGRAGHGRGSPGRGGQALDLPSRPASHGPSRPPRPQAARPSSSRSTARTSAC